MQQGAPIQDIPTAFQDEFRAQIEADIREAGISQNQRLQWLQQKRQEIVSGTYLTHEGNWAVSSLTIHDAVDLFQAVEKAEASQNADQRQNLVRYGAFALVAVVLLAFLLIGTGSDEPESDALAIAPTTTITPTPSPTPEIRISNPQDSLDLIGGSGGALKLGRPALLQIVLNPTEENPARAQTLPLPIDPATVNERGEMSYKEEAMLGESPLATWLFGTVLNYSIGIPAPIAASLLVGDRLIIVTDTGSQLHFVIQTVDTVPAYETGILAQDQIGVTLFGLPSLNERIPYAFAQYDVSQEVIANTIDTVPLDTFAEVGEMGVKVTAVTYHQTLTGLHVQLQGESYGAEQTALFGSLLFSNQQSEAKTLPIQPDGNWQLDFFTPEFAGLPTFNLVFPPSEVKAIELTPPPTFAPTDIFIEDATFNIEANQATLIIRVTNNQNTTLRLDDDNLFVSFSQGGEATQQSFMTPALPILVKAAEVDTTGATETVLTLTVHFPDGLQPFTVHIAGGVWQIE